MGAVLSSAMAARQQPPVPLFSPGSDPSLPLLTLTSDSRTVLIRFPDSMADLEAKVVTLFGVSEWAFVVRTAHGEEVEIDQSAFGALPVGGRVHVFSRGAQGKRMHADELATRRVAKAARVASDEVESRIEVDEAQPTNERLQIDQAVVSAQPFSPGSSATATETAHSPSADQPAPRPLPRSPTPGQVQQPTADLGTASVTQNDFALSFATPVDPISPTPVENCTAGSSPEQAQQEPKAVELEDGEISDKGQEVQSTGDTKVDRSASIAPTTLSYTRSPTPSPFVLVKEHGSVDIWSVLLEPSGVRTPLATLLQRLEDATGLGADDFVLVFRNGEIDRERAHKSLDWWGIAEGDLLRLVEVGKLLISIPAANNSWTYIEAEADDTVRWLKDEYTLHTGHSVDEDEEGFVDGDGSLAEWLSDDHALGELIVPYVSEVLVPLRILPLKNRSEHPVLALESPAPDGAGQQREPSPVLPSPAGPVDQPTSPVGQPNSPVSPAYVSPRSPLLQSPAHQSNLKGPLPHASEWEGWAHDPQKRSGIAHIIAMGNRPLKPAPSLVGSYTALLGAGSKALLGTGSWA